MSKYRNMRQKPLSIDTADGNALSVGARSVFPLDAATASSPMFRRLLLLDDVRKIEVEPPVLRAVPPPAPAPEPTVEPVVVPALVVSEPTFDVPGPEPLTEPSIGVEPIDVLEPLIEEEDTDADALPDEDGEEVSGEPGQDPRGGSTGRRSRGRRGKRQR